MDRKVGRVAEFEQWLLDQLPGLGTHLEAARREWGELRNEYAILSFAVKPYLESLRTANDEPGLVHAWRILEEIETNGAPQAQNELRVTLEEIDLWHVYRFMGPALRDHWFNCITWVPAQRGRFNLSRYQANWREEIERIGGLQNLTAARELEIRYRLKHKFKIEGLRAPEPGGEEWRAFGLPWPLPPPGADDAA